MEGDENRGEEGKVCSVERDVRFRGCRVSVEFNHPS